MGALAINQNPKELIPQDLFREDLYYRISEITIGISPFRDCDIGGLILAWHLLVKYAKQQGRAFIGLTDDASEAIGPYS